MLLGLLYLSQLLLCTPFRRTAFPSSRSLNYSSGRHFGCYIGASKLAAAMRGVNNVIGKEVNGCHAIQGDIAPLHEQWCGQRGKVVREAVQKNALQIGFCCAADPVATEKIAA